MVALGVAPVVAASPAAADPPPPTRTITSAGNPIIDDGSLYTADAAPLVGADGRLYLYTGHDEAATNQASFVMRDYNVLATDDPASGEWDVYEGNLKPGEVFEWATGNMAFAGHAVRGPDGRYYWYVPVQWENTAVPNRMAIGVAVADSPVGPWTDALGSPLLTWTDVFGSSTNGQEVIDPHVFFDDDGTTYLYWGSWNVARVVELSSMTEKTGEIRTLGGLTGFFEAPWVVKRNGVYHMVYDWKQGGSACTPSNYQACIGWATATSPLGPWTYRGIVMDAGSATTMHPSLIDFEGQWYLTYHTKDAVGGGHFRRSVAMDEVEWDGDTILPIDRTLADDPAYRLTDNVALEATPRASFTEQPPMRLGAVNDGFRATTALLPPDQWGNYRGTTSSNRSDWVSYQWEAPVRVDSAGIQFHQDGNWIRPPESWTLEYLDAAGDWQPVPNASIPTPANNVWHQVTFDPVTTTALRATFNGRPNGPYFHSVSVSEWEVYAVDGVTADDVEVVTTPGVAPELPEAVRATADGAELWAPVNWRDVAPASYADEGTFTVEGRALGVTGDHVTATVVVDEDAVVTPEPDAAPPVVSTGVTGTQGGDGWYSSDVVVRVRAEDAVDYRTTIETRVGDGEWTVAEDARYADVPVTTSGTTVVAGRARDAAGNESATVTRTVKVDKVRPDVTATLDEEARSVTVTASDALSGLDAAQYRFDGAGAWQPLTLGTPVAAPDGLPHRFDYRVADVAGNERTGAVQVPLDEDAELTGNVAKYATPTASFASSWAPVTGLNDGANDPLENTASEVGGGWGTWPQVGEQWVRYSWSFDVTADRVGVWWDADQPDTANAGLIPPHSWVLEYLDADGTTWRPVTLIADQAYARERGRFNEVRFEPVTARAFRVVGQSWGEENGQGSMGIREWQVIAAEDTEPEPVVVTPAEPTFTAATCVDDVAGPATVTLPDVEGVTYLVDGEVATGTVEVPAGATVAVTAVAEEGYVLADDAVDRWEHGFTAPDCTPAVTPGSVVVGGRPAVGRTLTAATSGWEPGGVRLSYQWYAGGAPVRGATHRTFVPRPADVGDRIRVRVTGSKGGFDPASRYSAWTARTARGTFTRAPRPIIDGVARVGRTVRALPGRWAPSAALRFRWFADGRAVRGATGRTLHLTPALRGTRLRVRVTGARPGYLSRSVLSAPRVVRRR